VKSTRDCSVNELNSHLFDVCHRRHTHPISTRVFFFFFNVPAPTEIYTLSLHDALPILNRLPQGSRRRIRCPRRTRSISTPRPGRDRKSTRLNSSHVAISYAVFCLKKNSTVRHR